MAVNTSTASGSSATVQEFSIRVPKNSSRSYHVMRFNGTLGVDFGKWSQIKMERENNMKEFRGMGEELPKFGAGSEFGREAKEEARRKKLGIIAKKYRPDDQPWILKSYGSSVKKFKGIREGGISENTAYYVFTHAEDGAIEAFPLHEWYKFQPIQRYKALSAEEAEMEFTKRNKHLNFFSLMLRKRLKGEDDVDLDEDGEKSKKTSKKKDKELKISELDEWMDSSDADSDSEREDKNEEDDDDDGDEADKKKKKKKKAVGKPKKKRDTNLEAGEDSDDGDEEGREVDYISDSSDSEPENSHLDGVAEEKGLKKLLNSDEDESEDSERDEKNKSNEDDDKDEENDNKKADDDTNKDKKKKKKDKNNKGKDNSNKKKKENDPDDDFSSDSSTDEDIKKKKNDKKDKDNKNDKDKPETSNENTSRTPSPAVINKRKIVHEALAGTSKKPKLDLPNFIPGLAESGITEDSVRKYLMRKPMTTTELLQKFKSKKTGLSSEQLVNIMTQILKKINPTKQTLKGKMYLSIKA